MSLDGTSAAVAPLRLFDALLPPFCSFSRFLFLFFPIFFFCQCDILDNDLFGNVWRPPSLAVWFRPGLWEEVAVAAARSCVKRQRVNMPEKIIIQMISAFLTTPLLSRAPGAGETAGMTPSVLK